MYACMATKTISVDMEAYERLRSARQQEKESFSKVIKRAEWPRKKGTAGALAEWLRTNPDRLTEEQIAYLDRAQKEDVPAPSKWES
jgi:predicted CopG family antitoxin